MRPKSALMQLASLLKTPSFTSQQAAKLGIGSTTLAHYVKTGDLERIDRGIYRAAEAPDIEDFRWEDLIHAIQKVKGGVVCLISALSYYDITEEIPRQHWIAVRNTTRHRAPPLVRVIRMRNLTLGKTEIKIGGISVPIFDRERTIIDAFRYLDIETAIKALKMGVALKGNKRVDFKKLHEYAKQLRVKIEPYILTVTT